MDSYLDLYVVKYTTPTSSPRSNPTSSPRSNPTSSPRNDEAYTVKDVLERIQDVCRKFGIYHTTVQLQSGVGKEVA